MGRRDNRRDLSVKRYRYSISITSYRGYDGAHCACAATIRLRRVRLSTDVRTPITTNQRQRFINSRLTARAKNQRTKADMIV